MRRVWMVAAAGLAVAAAGCATSGIGTGIVEAPGKPDAEGEAFFTWHAAADATHGTIQATLPDGRSFAGEFIQVTSTAVAHDFGPQWTAYHGPYGWGGYGGGWYDSTTTVREYSGQVIAQLEGPRGERMRCRFQLARPEDGPASGGVGTCELTGGERIEHATLRGVDD